LDGTKIMKDFESRIAIMQSKINELISLRLTISLEEKPGLAAIYKQI